MTLLVADDGGRSVPSVLAADAVTVTAEAVGDAVDANDPDVVVVDGPSVPDTDAVVRAVRAVSSHAGIVVVGSAASEADVTGVDPDESSILAAVERARRVADYRRSVSDLYDAARDRTLGRPDGDVRAKRQRADDCFAALPTDGETFAALLRTDEENSTDGIGETEATDSPDDEDEDG